MLFSHKDRFFYYLEVLAKSEESWLRESHLPSRSQCHALVGARPARVRGKHLAGAQSRSRSTRKRTPGEPAQER